MFGTCTADLEMLADWLKACHITTVAMESTGVYWIALFELLDTVALKFIGRSTADQARSRPTQERRARLSMDSKAAQLWPVDGVVSARRSGRGSA